MPIPLVVGRVNKVGLNRVTKPLASWMPGFGVVIHRGRRSGNEYRTPVNVFPTVDGYVIALTYGPEADWVKNVVTAGGCRLQTRNRVVDLTSPHIYRDESRRHIRFVERQFLRLLGVSHFMSLKLKREDVPH